ncbi:flagellar assembly protein FliX [Pelagibius sp.]|uniref:flagellar assembly protein FliX n=1 Tax=Pelagibius sp. TaxID=1931238 RepID=UPI002607B856|nr:flagellar assembly protein FliX [Pelagibius sp.]
MKINRLTGPRTTSKPRSAASATGGGGGFARALEGTATQSATAAGSTPVQAVNALLALQEVGDATAGPGRARRRAEDILEKLEELRLALVFGEISPERLERLTELLAQRREQIEDPKLAEIVNEIEIRAAVELAKRGR